MISNKIGSTEGFKCGETTEGMISKEKNCTHLRSLLVIKQVETFRKISI